MRVAIIGAGWMGAVHAGAVTDVGDTVACVIDPDADRARQLAANYGAATGAELAAARDCDAVIVATPSFAHLQQAEELVRMGLPILVEKPHRLPEESADGLRAALKSGGAPLRVGMTTRFNPGIRRLKAALDRDGLGQILSYCDTYHFKVLPETLAPWYFDPAVAGGGVVTTNGVHLIDRAGWLLGGKPSLVACDGLATVISGHAVEDHALLRMSVDDVPVTLSLLWAPWETASPELSVIGRAGIARVGLDHWRIETSDGVDEGMVPDPDVAFADQWRAFRGLLSGRHDGPQLADLDTMEHTMMTISAIYRQAGRIS